MRRSVILLLACQGLSSLCAAKETLLWSDEFDSGREADASVWSFDVGGGGWGNGEIQTYTADNVRVQGGKLIITTKKEDDGTITSGRIRTNGKLEFQYGAVEARIKVPVSGDGLWPALWMLGSNFPDVGWPKSGELDIMQVGSALAIELGKTNTYVGSAVHWEAEGVIRKDYENLDTQFDLTDDFHTYRMEWTPSAVTTYVNGIQILSKLISSQDCSGCEELHQPFFFVLNVAAGGGYTGIYNQAGITAPLPAELVVDYIRVYDNGFTKLSGSAMPETLSPRPSLLPTSLTSLDPTSAPTTIPQTLWPSLAPSNSPPSSSPSLLASSSPSRASSAVPTLASSPSSQPSLSSTPALPSRQPSIPGPTPLPSRQPSIPGPTPPNVDPSPTLQPSLKPQASNSLVQRFNAQGITMTLSNVAPLDEASEMAWAEVTGNHFAAEIEEVIGPELLDDVAVSIVIVSQDPPFKTRRALARKSAGRRLQVDEQKLTFDAVFLIQSVVEEHDVNRYIMGAFNTNDERELYLATLKTTGSDAFVDAFSVSVTEAVSVSLLEEPGSDNGGGAVRIGVIVGAVMAGLALIFLAAFFLSRRSEKRESRLSPDGIRKMSVADTDRNTEASPSQNHYPPGSPSDIDDDSIASFSLREAITPRTFDEENSSHTGTGTKLEVDDDSFFASIGDIHALNRFNDFDDESLLTVPSILNGSLDDGNTLHDDIDDDTLYTSPSLTGEYGTHVSELTPESEFVQSAFSNHLMGGYKKAPMTEFQVEAPAGNLGLVLDTGKDGIPVVEEIKNSSPLAGQVRAGDRLLSLDGQDVSTMIAPTVARLLASKKNREIRRFIFCRPEN
jgi:beta-glucanase (GH16 family)